MEGDSNPTRAPQSNSSLATVFASIGGSLQHQGGAGPHQVRPVYSDFGHPRQFPARGFAYAGNTRAINSPQGASNTSKKKNATEMCEPQNLSKVARSARRVFREAIVKRVMGERYGHKESQHTYLG